MSNKSIMVGRKVLNCTKRQTTKKTSFFSNIDIIKGNRQRIKMLKHGIPLKKLVYIFD